MKSLIYFSTRITDKLNMIKYHPITIVSGRSGIGKTFAVQAYFQKVGTALIWHASSAVDFETYLREFQGCLTSVDSMRYDEEKVLFPVKSAVPSSAAMSLAIAWKQRGVSSRLTYILDYRGTQIPEEVMEFLGSLSSQQMNGLYIVLIVRQAPSSAMMEHIGANVNLIPENYFLLTPAEIQQAFLHNDIALTDTEANYLYLRCAGWMPEVDRLFQVVRDKGKEALYESLDLDAFSWDDTAEWKNRFLLENDIWHLPALEDVRQNVEAMDLEKAYIAVERVRMRSERFTPTWDICDYYNAVLRMMNGNARTALEELNQGFELRIHHGLYQSAYRILMAQVQLKILLGENWFENEHELLISFANQRIYEKQGIASIAAGLTLWRAKESRKIIAYLGETDEKDEIDAGYREFLLCAAYHEIGLEEEAVAHLDAARNRCFNRGFLSAVLFNSTAENIDQNRKTQNNTGPAYPPGFSSRLSTWRRAMYKNAVSDASNGHQVLTVRERQVMECVARKMSNKEIAAHLMISVNTVKTILRHIYAKLGISNRHELQ